MRTVVDPAFRDALTARIATAGMSQNQLARYAHVSAGYLSEIVNGVKSPSVVVAKALDDALAANGDLAALVHPLLADDDADRFTAAVNSPAAIGRTAVESLAQVLAAQRGLDDVLGSAALLKPIGVQLDQIGRMVFGVRGPIRRDLMLVAAQWGQFYGWLNLSAGRFDDARRWLHTALLWATEAGSADLAATIVSYQAHAAWLTTDAASTISLAEAAMRDERVFPGQMAYDAFQAARGHAVYGDLAEVDRLLDVAESYADKAACWSGEVPAWQYQRAGWTWILERGLVLRYAARHDPTRSPSAVASLRAGIAAVPADWQGSEWFAEYRVHLASALLDGGELEQAASELDCARRIASSVSSPRVLQLVGQRERRLRNERLLSV